MALMSKTHVTRIACLCCGRYGIATWNNAKRSLSALRAFSEGFLAIDDGRSGDPRIVCQSCGNVAHEG
jgi:hypothetical protein